MFQIPSKQRSILPVTCQIIRSLQAPTAAAPSGEKTSVKSWREIPGPPAWPILGHINQYFTEDCKNGRMHIHMKKLNDKYGKMVRMEMFQQPPQVMVTDPDQVEAMMRQEGKYPRRTRVDAWIDYRHMNDLSLGLLTSHDETWLRFRQALHKKLLRPKNVHEYWEQLDDVMNALVTHIKRVKRKGDGVFIENLANEIYMWGMEAACVVLFEKRFGCLEEVVNPRAKKFIESIEKMWVTSLDLYAMYNWKKMFRTKAYKQQQEAWNGIFEIAEEAIRERAAELAQSGVGEDGEEMKGGLLSYLILNKELGFEDIVGNVTELMLAGVDTTSNSLCFALYLLTKYPTAKEKLYHEISEVVGDRAATTDDLQKMPYLKAVVKETMRLFPVAPLNARELTSPVVLNGYNIDAGALVVFNIYGMCHDPDLFPDPENFLPERWLRGNQEKRHPFAAVPFGQGVRSCIGRRFAEMELYLSIIKILQNFDLTPHGSMDQLQPFFRTILTPGKIVPVEFHDRT